MNSLTHLGPDGTPGMVDVGEKVVSQRRAVARAVVRLPKIAFDILQSGGETRKGNVFQVARIAGTMAAKRTSELIPLCHQIPLDGVDVTIVLGDGTLEILATVRCTARTGVEMEALTAASVTALTIYDMLKSVSHDLLIESIELLEKSGGRSGQINRHGERSS